MPKIHFDKLSKLLLATFKKWNDEDPFRHGATIAYYAIFSIPGLMIILIWTAGSIFGQEAVQGQISNQIQQYLGPDTAESIEDIIVNARFSGDNFWMKVLGIGTLILGATTLFLQLQKSLNQIWGVKANPKNGIIKLVTDRATSLGVILAIAFLLLISLLMSAGVSAVSTWIEIHLGEAWLVFIRISNFFASLGLTTALIAIMLRVLPDVEIGWRSVWVGAAVAGVLFTIGKTLLGLYFGYAEPGSSFGAAGTIILVMLWVNYTCLLLFFGASFSKVYADFYGHPITPSEHAKWIPVDDPTNVAGLN